MSDDIERIHGWPVNTPIPMRGGGVAYVVCECIGIPIFKLSGYFIGISGIVDPMQWTENGHFIVCENHRHDLDPSYRVIPEPELPLWTMEDSESLVGQVLVELDKTNAVFVAGISKRRGMLSIVSASGGNRVMSYQCAADNYRRIDGKSIPKRRMS